NGAGAGMAAVAHPAQQFPLGAVAAPPLTPPTVAACHDAALYTSRLAGYPSPLDWWLTLHAPDVPADAPAAALLIRGPAASGRAGFIPRDDTVPLLARALTPAGAACVAAVDAWEITDLECDR